MIKAAIFDMDGTMVNTEDMWKIVNYELAEMFGKVFDESLRVQMMGRKEDDALRIFKNFYQLDVDVSELQKIRKGMILKKLHMVSVNRGLYELLDLLDKKGIKKAIATSAFSDFATAVVKAVNVDKRFDVFITGDQIKNGKPDPETFIKAAELLHIDPLDCLVLEDAQNGVEAAYNAKMKVIVIPHIHSKDHDFSKATKVVSSMLEINEKMLDTL